jgi:hypothetical protein
MIRIIQHKITSVGKIHILKTLNVNNRSFCNQKLKDSEYF